MDVKNLVGVLRGRFSWSTEFYFVFRYIVFFGYPQLHTRSRSDRTQSSDILGVYEIKKSNEKHESDQSRIDRRADFFQSSNKYENKFIKLRIVRWQCRWIP